MSAPGWTPAPLRVETLYRTEGHHGEFAAYPDDAQVAGARCSCGWSMQAEGGDAAARALAALEEHYEREVEDLASPMTSDEEADG